jgi:hypothetical protein
MPRDYDYEDDDEIERPAKRKRRDDDEDERPAKSKRRDDDEEDERPARRARRRRDEDDEEEDERPARKAKRRSDDEDEDDDRPARRSRRRDDDEDEDERPKTKIEGGWGAAKRVADSTSSYVKPVQIGKDPLYVKFLEEGPFASFRQHWIERSGRKSFVCISEWSDKGCPLCDMGDNARALFWFNVAVLDQDGGVSVEVLEGGVRMKEQLNNLHTGKRTGPLNGLWRSVTKSGKGTSSTLNWDTLDDEDLEEEGFDVPSAKEIKALERKLHTAREVQIPSYREMKDLAADLDS